MWSNPSCQLHDWQNKGLTYSSRTHRQCHTARAFSPTWYNEQNSFTYPWSWSTSQVTWDLTSTRQTLQEQHAFRQSHLHQQGWKSSGTDMTLGPSTHKDSQWEHTGQHAKHSSFQTADVQHQQTDLRTTGEQLYTGRMATMRTLRKHMKTSTRHNRKEPYRDKHGQEKRGSEWREEHLFQATHRHSHQHYHHRQHNHQEQQRQQHQQWRHNNPWQNTQSRSQLTTIIFNIHLHPQRPWFHIQGCSTNFRLLDQRRTHVEKSTCPTTKGLVHVTTDRRWTRRNKIDAAQNINCPANKWDKRKHTSRWLDNEEESNTWPRVDRFNKLWRKHLVQRRVHHRRHRRTTRSKESTRPTSATTTHRTRETWTRAHTPTIQELVPCMCTKQRQIRQPSEAKQQVTSDTGGHHLLRGIRWNEGNTSPDSSWRRNRHVHGSTDRRQDSTHAVPVNVPSTIPRGMWQDTSHTQQHSDTIRSRRLLESTTQDDSNSSRKNCSETIASIYIPSTSECRTFPSNTTWTSQTTQTPTGEQLWHTPHKHTSHHAMDGETRSLPTRQVRSTLWWQHKLLQTMEQRT